MNKKQINILIVFMALVTVTALFLLRVESAQHLGKPGVKVVAHPIYDNKGHIAATNSVFLPDNIPGFESKELPITLLELNWLPKDTLYGRRSYQAPDGFGAGVSAVLMGADRTSIHQPEYCLPGQGWVVQKSELAAVPIPKPHPYDLGVRKLTATLTTKNAAGVSTTARGLYVYWFVADGQLTPRHGERMWWSTRDMLTSNVLQRWAYVSYFSTCQAGQEELLFERMKKLMALTVPEFQLAAGPGTPSLSSSAGPVQKGAF